MKNSKKMKGMKDGSLKNENKKMHISNLGICGACLFSEEDLAELLGNEKFEDQDSTTVSVHYPIVLKQNYLKQRLQ